MPTAQLDHQGVQTSFDLGQPHPLIEPLADLGRLRQQVRVAAGAIDLALPEQEFVREGSHWQVRMRTFPAADDRAVSGFFRTARALGIRAPHQPRSVHDHRVGESFAAVVLHADDHGAEVMLRDPPVVARCAGQGLREGASVVVRLADVGVARRGVR